ncbi:MAG: IS110 family transposase [Pseudomonadota bacterium]
MLYAGLDVSKQTTAICIRDHAGAIVWQGEAASSGDGLWTVLAPFSDQLGRVVLETGMLASLLYRALMVRGLDVVCVDARRAWAVMRQMPNKTDANDAAMLAELARTGFYRQVHVKGEAAQTMRTLLKARDLLVRQRMDTDNAIRSALLSRGTPLPPEFRRWIDRVKAAIAEDPALSLALQPLIELREAILASLTRLDRELRRQVKAHPVCRRLMTVPGIGPITSFAYVATIEDPSRFASSSSVRAYVGLTPRRHQSGQVDYTGRISKLGDPMLRTLLFEAASSLITRRFGGLPAMKRWALRLKSRVGHKKATVALARKMAVLLHRMWIDGTTFQDAHA